jgi:Phospholipase_D-nuclease N-terminal
MIGQASPTPPAIHIDMGGWGIWAVALVAFVLLLSIASLVVWIWALVDAIQVPDDSMYRSGTKLVWVLVIVFLQVIGAIIYFAVGRPERGASAPPGGSTDMPPPPGSS